MDLLVFVKQDSLLCAVPVHKLAGFSEIPDGCNILLDSGQSIASKQPIMDILRVCGLSKTETENVEKLKSEYNDVLNTKG